MYLDSCQDTQVQMYHVRDVCFFLKPQTLYCLTLPCVRHRTSLKEVFRKETYFTLFSMQWSRPLTELTRPITPLCTTQKKKRAVNLSILTVSGPGEFFPCCVKYASDATPGGALPPTPMSFSLSTTLLAEPQNMESL